MSNGWLVLLIGAVVGVVLISAVSFYIYYGRLYMRARVAGAGVSFGRMIRVSASGQSAHRIVTAYIEARRAGIEIALDDLEALAKAGGDPRSAVRRLFEARSHGETETSIKITDAGTKNANEVVNTPRVVE
jgi:uncharacterized protein YqfA (UPF0365 family)